MGIGRQVAWDSPSFPAEASRWAAPASKSWKPVLHHIWDIWQRLSQMPESYLCYPKYFGYPILMPLQGDLQQLWELSGQPWNSELLFQDASWALLIGTVGPGLVSHTKHSGASSWKMLFQAELELFCLRGCSISQLMSALLTFCWLFLFSHYRLLTIIWLLTNKGFFLLMKGQQSVMSILLGSLASPSKPRNRAETLPFSTALLKRLKQSEITVISPPAAWGELGHKRWSLSAVPFILSQWIWQTTLSLVWF